MLLLTIGITPLLLAQNPPTPTLEVTLRVDGKAQQIETKANTVEALLHQQAVQINSHDIVTPPLATPLADGMLVKVERVTFEIVDERYSIAPPVVTRWDRRMTVHPVVLREGTPGTGTRKRCMWKKDGVITVQWTQSAKTLVAPKPQIVVRGNLPSRAGMTGRTTMQVVATAYDPGPESCGRYASGYTAIGMRATRGVIAVDPKVIPLGSRVYVDGYGLAIAGDVGGAIKGRRIDVCFPTRAEALRWGRRTVNIVIMK